jgi:hypothetical protein
LAVGFGADLCWIHLAVSGTIRTGSVPFNAQSSTFHYRHGYRGCFSWQSDCIGNLPIVTRGMFFITCPYNFILFDQQFSSLEDLLLLFVREDMEAYRATLTGVTVTDLEFRQRLHENVQLIIRRVNEISCRDQRFSAVCFHYLLFFIDIFIKNRLKNCGDQFVSQFCD